jgi:hypothetical protein
MLASYKDIIERVKRRGGAVALQTESVSEKVQLHDRFLLQDGAMHPDIRAVL